jgi:Methylamine utilisation protein MauE
MKKQLAIETICFLFILLFVYAAGSKLLDVEKFRVQIGQSPLLTAFAEWVAWIIPVTELAVSVMLAVARWRLIGLYASFSLMTMFTAYIIAILQFSDYIPCSCGGILSSMGWTAHLVFNIGFTLLSVVGIILHLEQKNKIVYHA